MLSEYMVEVGSDIKHYCGHFLTQFDSYNAVDRLLNLLKKYLFCHLLGGFRVVEVHSIFLNM